ncbi:unnamed protein product [Prunus armeniaca]
MGGIIVCSTFVARGYLPEYSYGRSILLWPICHPTYLNNLKGLTRVTPLQFSSIPLQFTYLSAMADCPSLFLKYH